MRRISEYEIPPEIKINLGMTERCLLARMLTAYQIPVEYARDTFEHLFKVAFRELYKKRFPDEEQ